ncbi:MAG: four helix bundle protein [Candidatus Kerfeldbacteria bacterium CG_4_10_14_0_8_um_filter_42_10]|uniref:Four helix bundle protein n=1 Tax=Candidatus Kerfeldbacteria bacterium CG_4_10_14_0_8_um_filter_42_10 TaxID=2014248 RepID=A0A2M7RKW6_9BACT|nr:MAG: four helix bundle protein [Candidatus Kerfeldbacteria bacterium CG_4_10_14_0_8_um_filter_42_10]
MAQKFYDLTIWKEGHALLMEIYKVTAEFPKEEQYSLIDQIRRSANSVIANIAEAHGRYYFADKIRTLYNSRAEVEETQSHLRVALGLKYLTKKNFQILDKRYENLCKSINNFINSLYQQKK